jgi:hypothetical protein
VFTWPLYRNLQSGHPGCRSYGLCPLERGLTGPGRAKKAEKRFPEGAYIPVFETLPGLRERKPCPLTDPGKAEKAEEGLRGPKKAGNRLSEGADIPVFETLPDLRGKKACLP